MVLKNQFAFLFLISIYSFHLIAQDVGDVSAGDGSINQLDTSKSIKITFHKENYVLPYTKLQKLPLDAGKKEETQFQFSLKLQVAKIKETSIAVAYTQRSFWQVWDADNSRPFRENNYNPEVFYQIGKKKYILHLGYEHESNGEDDPKSRSIDRIFARMNIIGQRFKLVAKIWYPFNEEEYNPDLDERKEKFTDFYGFGDLKISALALGTVFSAYGRLNPKTHKGYLEGKMMWYLDNAVFAGFYYANGYGNSLREYQVSNEIFGFGFFLNP